MSQRTALRLDDHAEKDPSYLTAKYGTQTAAMKSVLAILANRERLRDKVQALVDEVEAESGPLTDEELEATRRYFQ